MLLLRKLKDISEGIPHVIAYPPFSTAHPVLLLLSTVNTLRLCAGFPNKNSALYGYPLCKIPQVYVLHPPSNRPPHVPQKRERERELRSRFKTARPVLHTSIIVLSSYLSLLCNMTAMLSTFEIKQKENTFRDAKSLEIYLPVLYDLQSKLNIKDKSLLFLQ